MKLKSTFLLLIIFSIIHSLALASDAYLTNLSLNTYLKANTNYDISLHVKNLNNSPITYFTIYWQLDNGIINSKSYNVGGGGITSSNYLPIVHSTPINITNPGNYHFKVWISNVNTSDNNHANDTIHKDIIVLSSYVTKKVLIEEFTATSCQHCPAGNTVLNTISSNENAVVAAIHSNGNFSTSQTIGYAILTGSNATPQAIINRGEFGEYDITSNYSDWNQDVTNRIGISPVDISFTQNYNSTTRLLTINTKVNFKQSFPGNYYLNVYVLESRIIGYQAGASNNYTHNHVVRNLLGGTEGFDNVIPQQPVANTDYIHQDTITIPSTWNAANLEIIAYVYEKNQNNLRNVLNAAKYYFNTTGIENLTKNSEEISAYPNPVSNRLTIQLDGSKSINLQIFSIDGKMVYNQYYDNTDSCIVPTESFPSGLYFIKINDKEDIKILKIIKK